MGRCITRSIAPPDKRQLIEAPPTGQSVSRSGQTRSNLRQPRSNDPMECKCGRQLDKRLPKATSNGTTTTISLRPRCWNVNFECVASWRRLSSWCWQRFSDTNTIVCARLTRTIGIFRITFDFSAQSLRKLSHSFVYYVLYLSMFLFRANI